MAEASDHFRQRISFAEVTGRDAYGKPTLSPVSTAPARVQPLQKLIRDAKGSEALASHVVFTTAALTLNSRVWFPGEPTTDVNRARRPLSIGEFIDGAGVVRYRKVWF
jgi:hypothetical protein